jgi:uncharacterized membrane protein YozB (DUF420 family)
LGFFGGHAPYAADLNVIAQAISFCLLFAGVYFIRAGKLKTHSRLMKSAIIIEFGALIIWMGPSLLLNIEAFRTFTPGTLVTALHAFGGVSALTLAICAAYHKRLGSFQLKWTMLSTFLVWALAALLGISFYVYYYLI